MTEQADGVDIVFCSSDNAEKPEQVKWQDSVQTEIWDQDKQILEFVKHKRMSGMLWNKLIRRSIAKNAHFNPKTGYGEDAEFLWQVLQNTDKILVTNEILYHHVLEDANISHLSYSDKKYSAIPMWEKINEDVERDYPQLISLARTSITSAAVFGLFEARQCG